MIEELVTGKQERKLEYGRRRKRFDTKKIKNSEIELEEKAGWARYRKLKHDFSVVQKLKALDEYFENRIWCVLYLFGYEELNKGRRFKIEVTSNDGKKVKKQVDVFAKDESTVVVVECKTCLRKEKRQLQADIGEFASNQKAIANAIRAHYGKEFKPKIIWILATQNIIWSDSDRKRAAQQNIAIIEERELRYYEEIAKNIGQAAKYQFLAEFLQDQKVPSLAGHVVPAIRAKIGGHRAYYFLVSPYNLLPIAFVNHRDLRDPSGAPAYQRLVKKSRLRKIGEFLSGGGFFPNAILINFQKKPRFDQFKSIDERHIAFGNLYLPDTYKSAWVIDGQHRLLGFTAVEKEKRRHAIAVVAFDGIERTTEADLFATINSQQTKVSRNILDELEGELKWGSEDERERAGAIISRALDQLRSTTGSPFEDRIRTPELPETEQTCLTIPELKKAISASALLGRFVGKDKIWQPGPLSRKKSEDALEEMVTALSEYFELVRATAPGQWELGKSGLLCTNVGVAGYVRLFAALIDFMKEETGQEPAQLDAADVVEQIRPFLKPVLTYIGKTEPAQFAEYFRTPFGSGGPRKYFYQLVRLTNEEYGDFKPEGFADYVTGEAAEFAEKADGQTKRIVEKVHGHVIDILRKVYGAEFFDEGIPQKKIKMACHEKRSEEPSGQRKPPETYLDFVHLKDIVELSQNWEHFKDTLAIKLPKDRQGLAKYLSWFDQINRIRRISAHPYDRRYTTEDLSMLDLIEGELEKKIPSAYREAQGRNDGRLRLTN